VAPRPVPAHECRGRALTVAGPPPRHKRARCASPTAESPPLGARTDGRGSCKHQAGHHRADTGAAAKCADRSREWSTASWLMVSASPGVSPVDVSRLKLASHRAARTARAPVDHARRCWRIRGQRSTVRRSWLRQCSPLQRSRSRCRWRTLWATAEPGAASPTASASSATARRPRQSRPQAQPLPGGSVKRATSRSRWSPPAGYFRVAGSDSRAGAAPWSCVAVIRPARRNSDAS
jgi:hypothetical protein